jgi:hypothetical protein
MNYPSGFLLLKPRFQIVLMKSLKMNNRPHSGRNLCHLVQAFKRVVDGAKHTEV